VFETGGSACESAIWADLEAMRSAFAFSTDISSVTAQLNSKDGLDGFAAPLTADKQDGLSVTSEIGYYRKVSQGLPEVINAVGVVETLIFSLGAVLGRRSPCMLPCRSAAAR
jgi:putative ABC transport system permease protein